MRKSRILSLLLAVAVMATMLVAVPLTASAAAGDVHYKVPKDYTSVEGDPNNIEGTAVVSEGIILMYTKAGATAEANTDNGSKTDFPYKMPFRADNDGFGKSSKVGKTGVYVKALANGKLTFHTYCGSLKAILCNGREWYTPSNTGYSKQTMDVVKDQTYVFRQNGTDNYGFLGLDFIPDVEKPTVELDKTEAKAYAGGSVTLIPTVKYFAEGTDAKATEWEISEGQDQGITVDKDPETGNGIVKVAPGTNQGISATVKATVTDSSGTSSATCKITVAESKNDLHITGDNGVKSVSIKKDDADAVDPITFKRGSSNITTVEGLEFGEYTVEVDYATSYYKEPVIKINSQTTNTFTLDETCSPETPISVQISTEMENKVGEGKSAGEGNDYSAINKKITWDLKSGDGKSDNQFLSIEGSSRPGTDFNVKSDTDENVYMTVNAVNGKFNTRDSEGHAQVNKNTVFTIPVTPYSTVTFKGTEDRTLKIEDGSQSETITTSKQNPNKGEASYVYKGNTNGTIKATMTHSSSLYLESITVTPLFGTADTDSGYYMEDSDKKGVIRFFQSFAGNTKVEEYGFYFINSVDGGIDEQFKTSATGEIDYNTYAGMYGDFIGIKDTDFKTTFYAKPYVKISGINEPIYGAVFDGTVGDNPKCVDKPE